MPKRAPPDVGFGNGTHFDRTHDPSLHAELLKSILHCDRVDYGCQHAHLIRSHTVHVRCGNRYATKEISAADHQAELYTRLRDLGDFGGHSADLLGINSKARLPGENFAGQLQ
jgi:hypothetical protein